MLFTGLLLYLPALAGVVGRRELVKNLHIAVAIAWLVALALIAVAGNRRSLTRTWREFESLDEDDRRWLRLRRAPQGRFNAGQKLHALIQCAVALLFVLSGVLLWLGERNTTFRLPGTVVLHDFLTFSASALVIGHIYLALVHASTRPAMGGMISGTVPLDWAARHHSKWKPDLARGGKSGEASRSE